MAQQARERLARFDPRPQFAEISTQRRGLLREAVVEVAAEAFAGDGFHAVRMEELAARLGISKPKLYTAFPSKDVLFKAVLLEERRHLEAQVIEPLLDRERSIHDRGHIGAALVGLLFDYRSTRPYAVQLLFGPLDWQLHTSLRVEACRRLVDVVRAQVAGNAPRPNPPDGISSRGFATAVTTAVLGVLHMADQQYLSLLQARSSIERIVDVLALHAPRTT